MDKNLKPGPAGGEACSHKDFANGLRCFRNDDYTGALAFFRAADTGAALGDCCQSRYTSFHGLSRVCLGDSSGAKLCRKAAAGETRDAEVFYNLAMVEQWLENGDSAWMALRRGLRIDPGHAGLGQLEQAMQQRTPRFLLPGLAKDKLFDRLLGRLFRGTRKSAPDD